jgi:hypothetical protein
MGSAASTLSPEDTGRITKELRKKYELYQEEKIPDAEIQQKLTEEYTRRVEELTATKNKEPVKRRGSKDANEKSEPTTKRKGSRDESVSVESRQMSKAASVRGPSPSPHKQASATDLTAKASQRVAAKGVSGKHSGPATRRKSFDNPATKNPLPPPLDTSKESSTNNGPNSRSPVRTTNPPLTGKPSVPEMETATEVVDSWDSVTQQPYCKICQMAFKSDTFLDRHIKFSDLHAKNVKKANGEEEEKAAAAAEEKKIEMPEKKLLVKQVEGEHYILLYSGSKFFWRTQDTIDLHIYLHILPNCLEVISYDTNKSKETNRIYLDYGRLVEVIKTNKNFQWEETDEEGKRNQVITFVLQRLQLSTAANNAFTNSKDANDVVTTSAFNGITTSTTASVAVPSGNILVFAKQTGDDFTTDPSIAYNQRTPVLEKPPVVLVPITITRRRRTNAEEIDATITGLTNDRAALVAATGRAEKVASLVYAGANAIAAKKWYSDLNPLRKRWIMAIRRVIRLKHVAEIKEQLKAFELKKEQEAKKSVKRNNTFTKAKEI